MGRAVDGSAHPTPAGCTCSLTQSVRSCETCNATGLGRYGVPTHLEDPR